MDTELEQLQMAFILGQFGFRSGRTLNEAPYEKMSNKIALHNSWRRGYMTELSTVAFSDKSNSRVKCPKCSQEDSFTFVKNDRDTCFSSWICQTCFYSDSIYGAIPTLEGIHEHKTT